MAEVEIDPDGVLAMSAAALSAAGGIAQVATEVKAQVDKCSDEVPGAPQVVSRTQTESEALATAAGFARDKALHYIDHEQPVRDLLTAGYWLPDFANLGYDPKQTVSENLERIARSDEFGAGVLGTAQGLLERYRNYKVFVPRTDVPVGRAPAALARFEELATHADDTVGGTALVRRASGLLVPQGGSGDPRIAKLSALAEEGFHKPGPGLVTDTKYLRPPGWAKVGGKALGVAGAGLTLYDSYMSQWDEDSEYHPDWSTGHKVADASYNMATEGGGAVAGGIVGAELGATVGSFVPIPVVGTVGGALIGGAIGAFAGSKLGKATGDLVKEGASKVADGAKHVWHSVFG